MMQFNIEEAKELKYLNKQNFYDEEQKIFENGSRIPIALVVKGISISDMRMEYVKFLF